MFNLSYVSKIPFKLEVKTEFSHAVFFFETILGAHFEFYSSECKTTKKREIVYISENIETFYLCITLKNYLNISPINPNQYSHVRVILFFNKI